MADGIDVRLRYCVSLPGLLKWLHIIVSCVVIGLLCWENVKETTAEGWSDQLHDGEVYTVIVAVVTLIGSLLFLILFFLNCHRGPCSSLGCTNIAYLFYLVMALAWLAAGGVEAWVAHDWKGRYYKLYERRAAASGMCFLNAILFFLSLQQAKFSDI